MKACILMKGKQLYLLSFMHDENKLNKIENETEELRESK